MQTRANTKAVNHWFLILFIVLIFLYFIGYVLGLGTKMERSFTSLLFSFIYLIIYAHLSLHIYPLTSYHIHHSTKTFTTIYLE